MSISDTGRLKAAILGCGKIGWEFQDDPGAARFGVCTHAAAWSALPDEVELVAVADADEDRARRCAARWGVPHHFPDAQSLLEGVHPQIVSIATPDDTHFALALQCLQHPSVRAVLVEKPLAASVAQAQRLSSLAQELGKVIVVNYSRRFCPIFRGLRDAVRRGEYGPLHLVRGIYTKGLRHNGFHFLDLIHFWFEACRLESFNIPSWAGEARDLDDDPPAHVTFAAAPGSSGALHCMPHQAYTLFEMDLCFARNRFLFTDGGDTLETYSLRKDTPFVGYTSLALESKRQNCVRDYLLHAAQHVLAVLKGIEQNLSSPDTSVYLLQQYYSLCG